MKIFSLLCLSLFVHFVSYSQDIKQNIRGTIVDSESKFPLVGTKVKVIDVEPVVASVMIREILLSPMFQLVNTPLKLVLSDTCQKQ